MRSALNCILGMTEKIIEEGCVAVQSLRSPSGDVTPLESSSVIPRKWWGALYRL
jgi:hypothetical protein